MNYLFFTVVIVILFTITNILLSLIAIRISNNNTFYIQLNKYEILMLINSEDINKNFTYFLDFTKVQKEQLKELNIDDYKFTLYKNLDIIAIEKL